MGESKSSGPHGGRAQGDGKRTGPLSVTPLGKGCSARDADRRDSSVRPVR